jgi:translation initiation factor 1A
MPKTNIRGGNKRKKGKNGTDEINRTLDFAIEGQNYGHVSKVLGAGNFTVKCYEKNSKGEFTTTEKLCHVRGKLRKKVWINLNDLVLLSLREFDISKGDIIHKYTNDEEKKLKKMKIIPSVEVVNGRMEETDDIGFDYNTNTNTNDNTEEENTDEEIEKI